LYFVRAEETSEFGYTGIATKTTSIIDSYARHNKRIRTSNNNDDQSSFVASRSDENSENLFGIDIDSDGEEYPPLELELTPTEQRVRDTVSELADDYHYFSTYQNLIDDGFELFLEWTFDPEFETKPPNDYLYYRKKIFEMLDLVEKNRLKTDPSTVRALQIKEINPSDRTYGLTALCCGCNCKKPCKYLVFTGGTIQGRMGTNCAGIYSGYKKILELTEQYIVFITNTTSETKEFPPLEDLVEWFTQFRESVYKLFSFYIGNKKNLHNIPTLNTQARGTLAPVPFEDEVSSSSLF